VGQRGGRIWRSARTALRRRTHWEGTTCAQQAAIQGVNLPLPVAVHGGPQGEAMGRRHNLKNSKFSFFENVVVL
jgi:hypothetical protein